ncbi:MAG: PDZ domain-containing protein [Chitinophagaceae bacterium]
MKKQLYSLLAVAMLAGITVHAQDDKKAPKAKIEKKEVTINTETTDDGDGKKKIVINKSKNGKEEKMVIVVDGDKVTINGKPAKDYKGQMHMFEDGDFDGGFNGDFNMHFSPQAMAKGRDMIRSFSRSHSNKAMLGVSTDKTDKGAKVTEVVKESAAEKAGIKEGDIIISVNSDKITEENGLVKLIGKYKPEDVVDVTVLRDGSEKKISTKLGKNDSPMAMTWNSNDNDNDLFRMSPMPRIAEIPRTPRAFNFNGDNWPMLGLRSDRPKYGFSIADNEDGDGVKITSVKDESVAAKAGLKEGDLVTEVNGSVIKNTDELKKQLVEMKDKNEVSMKVLRNGSSQTISVKVPKKIKTADL